jgi:hypothetical protein
LLLSIVFSFRDWFRSPRAIRDIYGAEAIPAVDKAMKSSVGDREATARLARLRESLPR